MDLKLQTSSSDDTQTIEEDSLVKFKIEDEIPKGMKLYLQFYPNSGSGIAELIDCSETIIFYDAG